MTPDSSESSFHTSPTGAVRPCARKTHDLSRELLGRVSDKWTMLVMEVLADGPQRFTQALAAVPGISHRMLTTTLRALHRDGMVTRTAYAEVPPRVEYELTPLGLTLTQPIKAFVAWADEHQLEVESNRTRFDG